jgi:hypothetical protein
MTNDNPSAAGQSAPAVSLLLVLLSLALAAGPPTPAFAQEAGQKVFNSPVEAADALAAAAQKNDDQALRAIFGPSAKDLISSGDPAQDKENNERFAASYHRMHRFVETGEGRTLLYVGPENWPTPIPLQKAGARWYFDSAFGRQEVLYRRIGSNELNVIQVCDAIVAGQQEYFQALHDGETVHQYARRFKSSAGKQDGLYWKVNEGEPESPLGPLVAQAAADTEHHAHLPGGPHPFHGYIYRILTRQGADAAGGAKDYVVDGKLTGGFAVVAYPVHYRVSGVMTFIVNQDGKIYESDLGAQTEQTAAAMTEYNPDKNWSPVEGEGQEAKSQ